MNTASADHVRVSLIVTTYNWKEALALVLLGVSRQKRMPDEVIVADDGSDADTLELLHAVALDFPVPLRTVWQAHTGFRVGEARNRAVAVARGDYVILLDGDMVPQREFIADHMGAARRRCFTQGMRALAGRTLRDRMLQRKQTDVSPISDDLSQRGNALRAPVARWMSRPRLAGRKLVMSCNQGFWRSDFIEVNGFDERMAGWGREDTELAIRCYNAGIARLQLRHVALAVHLDHAPRGHGGARTENDVFLSESEASGRIRCERGIDRHLAVPVDAPDLRPRSED
ncbi:MAG: glycosyltransferase family 2 protein [Dokdonella sp.]